MVYYLLLAHTYPKYVENLCNVLKGKIYVHLDKRQNMKDWEPIVKDKKNIKFVSNRIKINWGGWSMIQGTLNGLKEIYPSLKEDDHVVIISGQDYPIKNSVEIDKYFQLVKGKSIVNVYDDEDWNNNLVKRYHGWYYRDLNIPRWIDNIFHFLGGIFYDVSNLKNPITVYIIERFLNLFLPKRRYLIDKFKIYGGSQRMALSTKHVKYLLDYVKTKEGKKVSNSYERVLIPDETFFHTLLLNSKYKNEIINESLWYIDWKSGPEYPRILRLEDYEKMKKSNKLFARKFDTCSCELIERINKQLFNQKN